MNVAISAARKAGEVVLEYFEKSGDEKQIQVKEGFFVQFY